MTDTQHEGRSRHQLVGLLLGSLLAKVMMLSGPPRGLSEEGWLTACAGMLMAIAWVTRPLLIQVPGLAALDDSLVVLYLAPKFL